jgi:hypothetical protein
VIGLHLVQNGQRFLAASQLRSHQGPQRIVLDLVVMVQLLVNESPVGAQP